ncbi:MAG: hypothetical protein AAGA54_09825 [Myxococcota bacterium]
MRTLRLFIATLGFGAFGLVAGASCTVESDFQCTTNENCVAEGGEGGVCESNNFCTFPDPACTSGKRWHDRASSLAGICFGDEGMSTATTVASGTDGETDTAVGSSSTDPTDASTDPGTSSMGETTAPTTDPTTDPTMDPTMDPTEDPTDPTTGDGDTSTGGVAMSCDQLYGGADDYLLCVEADDSCSFNTTTMQMTNCTQVCESFGGMCLSAQFNEAELCTANGDTTCDDAGNMDLICTCSR